MLFHDKFGQPVSPYDLSRHRELEREAARRKAATPPKGSPYDLGHAARVNRHFNGKPRRTSGGYSL